MLTTTQTTRISALLPSLLVNEVKKVSIKEKITQSSIIKKALAHWLHNRLKSDVRSLSKMDFQDLPSEEEWNLIQAPI